MKEPVKQPADEGYARTNPAPRLPEWLAARGRRIPGRPCSLPAWIACQDNGTCLRPMEGRRHEESPH